MKRLRARNQNGSLLKTAKGEYQATWYEYILNPENGQHERHHRSKLLGRIGNGKHDTLRKVDAEKKLRELVDPANGQAKQDSRVTVAWFIDNKFIPAWRQNWSGPTIARNRQYVDLYLKPMLGERALEEVDITLLQVWLGDLADRRKLAESVVKKARGMCKSILEYAAELEFIPRNPARSRFYRMPRCRPTRRPVISREQLDALWRKITDVRDRLIIEVATVCALRASEVFGLTWECVFADHILIRSVAYEGKLYEFRTKSKDSFRTVHIPPQIVAQFKKWKMMCESAAANDPVFMNDTGAGPMWSGIFLQKRIQPLAKEIGIKVPVTFQVLRRSFCTHNQKDLKAAQGVAGHSSILLTADVYAQDVPEEQAALVNSYYSEIKKAGRRVQ